MPCAPLVPCAGIRAVVAGVAAARAHRRMVHRVGGEARRRIGVAIAALDAGDRNVRRRRHAGRRRAVVAVRAIGVGRLVNEGATGPAREGRGRTGVAGHAILAIGRDVTGIRRSPLRTFGALARIGAVVAGVAAGAAHRRVVHRIGVEARRRIGVAIAALHDTGRNMRRRGQAGRGQTVVAIRAIRIGCLVDIECRRPSS